MAIAPTLDLVSETAETQVPQAVLDALQDVGPCGTTLPSSCQELIRSARMAGASWDQIGGALNLTATQARSLFVQSVPSLPESSPRPPADLDDDELMDLAVAETKAVRRLHPTR